MAGKQSAEVREELDEAVQEIQREMRFVSELAQSEQWKYLLKLLESDRQDTKRLARSAGTDFLYLRASLAAETLETIPDILARRKQNLDALLTQKKFQFEQFK